MASLLLVVFLVELAAYLVNTIGAATVNNVLWTLYLILSTASSRQASERKRLQAEYLRCRRDLNATSSQDEFAKWAKLRRHHDKLLDQLEKMKNSSDTSRTQFDRTVGAIRWSATRGLKLFLPFWYSRQPMFWLPQGWFPYYIEWILSLPRAPLGSISLVSWQMACTGVITLVGDTATAILGLVVRERLRRQQEQKRKQNMKARMAPMGVKPSESKKKF